jgi:HK97 family phage major capsid protein
MSDTSNGGPPAFLPAPPAVATPDFRGFLVPPQVQGRIISLIADQAPFANSLTRLVTNSSAVVFPVASPEGAAWVPELGRIPLMSLNDDAVVVAVAKLAGLLDLSNEMISDSTLNLTNTLTQLLGDSLSPQLDQGILYGDGPPEPAGVVAVAEAVTGDNLLDAVAAAMGAISDAGGAADTVAMPGSVLAAENVQRTTDGHLLYANGFAATIGLNTVSAPELTDVLVYDSRRLYLVLNGQLSSVDISPDFRFAYDATTMRVKSRVAVGCPAPAKTIRKWAPAGGFSAGRSTPTKASKSTATKSQG